jgi:3-oxoacyl-[acyl-carrier-protein] synthase II
MSDRICVTGMGIVSALGENKYETEAKLLKEKSGIGKLYYLNSIHNKIPVGMVRISDDKLKAKVGVHQNTIMTRTTLLGIVAAREAIIQAKLLGAGYQNIGFISGTTVGGMEKSELYYLDFLQNDKKNEYISIHDCGACTEDIAKYLGTFEFCTTISTACSSAANAIILGANMLKTGMLDAVVVGGSECLTKFHLNGFNTLMILDSKPCKPFDANRAGITLGEGAGYLVLEKESNALNRNTKPLCTLSGYGNACDAYHQTASSPDGKGAYLSMKKALDMSGLKPEDIGYINAHGTGTLNNDLSEGIAIQTLFDQVPYISSTKSFTGHTTSAAGAVESVISILAMMHNFIPANLNFVQKMEELTFEPVKHTIMNINFDHFLKNSFGFGGNNSSLIFSKYQSN